MSYTNWGMRLTAMRYLIESHKQQGKERKLQVIAWFPETTIQPILRINNRQNSIPSNVGFVYYVTFRNYLLLWNRSPYSFIFLVYALFMNLEEKSYCNLLAKNESRRTIKVNIVSCVACNTFLLFQYKFPTILLINRISITFDSYFLLL